MITEYRCPSCYTEFENAEQNSKCERCGIDAFQIGHKEEPPLRRARQISRICQRQMILND